MDEAAKNRSGSTSLEGPARPLHALLFSPLLQRAHRCGGARVERLHETQVRAEVGIEELEKTVD